MNAQTPKALVTEALHALGVDSSLSALCVAGQWHKGSGKEIISCSPIDGASVTAPFASATADQTRQAIEGAATAFPQWRDTPAPLRGEYVRLLGERFRKQKQALATIVCVESGKIMQEALGEVQEMIDICDFALGLSRQLYGRSIVSERAEHRLAEQWHPLGPVGIISAFNFPVAVWAWNAALAWVCGDTLIWKPSEKTPLCAIACQHLAVEVANEMGVPSGISNLVIGRADAGEALAADRSVPLVSATGSVPMGRAVAQTVAARLGKTLLELGGNNALVVAPSADMDLAIRSIVFSAVGTCGQRCTTLRRLILHESIAEQVKKHLSAVYQKLPIGNPLEEGVLVGPLVDQASYDAMQAALKQAAEQGGKVEGGQLVTEGLPGGQYVRPALVEISPDAPIVQTETFAPILYLMTYRELDEAIAMQNDVPQGLSSAIITNDMREAERFCSAAGSDCGIANVNLGTSGAEIGGAFGGEKETGGGRESGSDSWKAYMRRATNTVNYSSELPLAQGIRFDID